ncbi:MAG: peptidoglycan-binding domain-containing protein [Acidobacteriota bacterium]
MFRVLLASLLMILAVPAGKAMCQTAPDSQNAIAASITEKEVRAVQQELFKRGFLEKQPSGALDGATREALIAFQKKEGLSETGKIDDSTVEKLGLAFPLDAEDARGNRRNGILPRIGYAIKDETTNAGKAIGGAARTVGRGARTGAQKTVDVSQDAAGKTGETAKTAGDKSVDGARTVGRGVQKASTEVTEVAIGRSDERIHKDVRDVLNGDDNTRSILSNVKEGRVTLTTEVKSDADLSPAISDIRKISGVRSVVVINK